MLRARFTFLLVILASLALVSPAAAGSRADDPGLAAKGKVLVGYTESSSEGARDRATARVSPVDVDQVTAGRGRGGPIELLALPGGVSNSDAIAALERDPAVAYAEPNWIVRKAVASTDPYFANGSLWGMYGDGSVPVNQYGSQASEAWALGNTGSRNVYVGVIDEGIQYTHGDLNANAWTNPFDRKDGVDNDGNGYKDDVNGWDFAGNNNTIYDGGTKGNRDDHGTHVTGTIAAEGNNADAQRNVVGVNWNVTYISTKFLGTFGGTTANAIKALDYLTDLKKRHGLNIVAANNSWGGGGFSQGLLAAIVRAANQNILFVAAAGNSGTNNDTTASYPSNYDTTAGAGYDSVIAVAAIAANGALASFSQYGPNTVDLGAPGVGVWSTTAFNKYSSYNGTSMATPHVTGAAALYASTHPGAGAAAIRSAILTAGAPTASLAGKTATGKRLNAGGF